MTHPISWLLLERYHLDEVSPEERALVDRALAQNMSLRERLDSLKRDVRALPPLPRVVAEPSTRARPRWPWLLAPVLAATAALLLIVLRPPPEMRYGMAQRPGQIRIKGGTLAIALVRERQGVVTHAPRHFAADDRFKVLLTCPPGGARSWEVVVFQGGEAFFPLGARRKTRCGNRVTLPGAFRLDGTQKARVCAMIGKEQPRRDALRRGGERALPATSVCAAPLSPQLEP